MARAAQAARVPYTLGALSGIDVERAAELAPDVPWFQLYRFARNDHEIGFDLVRRAADAGAHVLVLTIDTPIRTTRPREVKSGITNPFRMTNRLRLQALSSPRWFRALLRNGVPRFVSLAPYIGANPGFAGTAAFVQREFGGAFTWEEIARYRDKWHKPLVLRGVLHPDDAERAISLGLDGIFVSNHGGRQIDALPPPKYAITSAGISSAFRRPEPSGCRIPQNRISVASTAILPALVRVWVISRVLRWKPAIRVSISSASCSRHGPLKLARVSINGSPTIPCASSSSRNGHSAVSKNFHIAVSNQRK